MYYDLVWLCIHVFLHCGILIDFVCAVNLSCSCLLYYYDLFNIQLSADRFWDLRNVCVCARALRGPAFSLRGLLFGSWATTENPGYIPLHSHHTNTSCWFCSWMGMTTQTLHSYTNCSSPPLQFDGMFHTRGLICQPKWHFVSFPWWFSELSMFCLCDLWGNHLNANNLQLMFPHIWINKTIQKSVFTPWHWHQTLFWAFHALLIQFSRVWRKIHANILFL